MYGLALHILSLGDRFRITGINIEISCSESRNCLGLLFLAGAFNVTSLFSKSRSYGDNRLTSIDLKPISFKSCRNAEYFDPKPAIS